jgi:hypothetical protein
VNFPFPVHAADHYRARISDPKEHSVFSGCPASRIFRPMLCRWAHKPDDQPFDQQRDTPFNNRNSIALTAGRPARAI